MLKINESESTVASRRSLNVANCRMVDFEEFQNETLAKRVIRQRGFSEYKRCKHCWDDTVRTD